MLRRHIRQEKQKHTAEEFFARSEPLWEQVESLEKFRRAGTVAAYWSLADEVRSHEFVEKWCGRKRMLLPVMRPGGGLELCEYRPGYTMNEAAFGLREPEGPAVAAAEVDLILVPGMAFDRNNHRLGRGKGYYDRLLNEINAWKIGVCFDFQRVEEVPVEGHDVAMDLVVSG